MNYKNCRNKLETITSKAEFGLDPLLVVLAFFVARDDSTIELQPEPRRSDRESQFLCSDSLLCNFSELQYPKPISQKKTGFDLGELSSTAAQ